MKTLHNPDGKLVWAGFWFEPRFEYVPPPPFRLNKKWNNAKEDEREIRGLMRRSKYPDDLKGALIRYCRALDTADFESAFVALWAVFEHLTHTVGESYSTTVKRCLILHDDPAYHRMILEHLRSKRNRIVHFTEQTEYGETLVYQLKRYVEEALRFHLGSSGTYASIGEAATFLDLPSDPKILEDQIKLRRRALKYIS